MVTSRSRTQRTESRKAAFRSHFESACIKTHRLDEIGVERLLLNNGTLADLDRLQAIDQAIVHAETLGDEALVVCSGQLGAADKIADYLHVDTIHAFRSSDFRGALIGLLGASGKLLALGIIDSVDFRTRTVNVFSTAGRFSAMQFGSMKLDRTDFNNAGAFGPETLRP
jgi:polynucleotide 5'-kinase involved in rRNA processing